MIRPAITALWSAENASLLTTTSLNGLGISICLIELGYHLINPENGLRADHLGMSMEPGGPRPAKSCVETFYEMTSNQQTKTTTC